MGVNSTEHSILLLFSAIRMQPWTIALVALTLLDPAFLPSQGYAYEHLSCAGLCGSFAPDRECFCDGYCTVKGDCCDDFEDECDVG